MKREKVRNGSKKINRGGMDRLKYIVTEGKQEQKDGAGGGDIKKGKEFGSGRRNRGMGKKMEVVKMERMVGKDE